MNMQPVINVVDDDASVRDSIRVLLESTGYAVRAYDSAESFLAQPSHSPGCVLTDIRMQGMDGLALLAEVRRRALGLPVIVITGHADIPLAVRAMKQGAADFLEKPLGVEIMLASIRRALANSARACDKAAQIHAAKELLARLTPRERQVLDHLMAGQSNRVMAQALGLSSRTIELHRAHIMDKMRTRSISDVVRIALAAVPPGPQTG